MLGPKIMVICPQKGPPLLIMSLYHRHMTQIIRALKLKTKQNSGSQALFLY
jgi:hypothetical protein